MSWSVDALVLAILASGPQVGMFFTTTDDGPQLATTPLKLILLICSTLQLEKFIYIFLVALSPSFRNGVDSESRNILDTDEVMRMAIELSYQVRVKVVTKSYPFHLTNLLIKQPVTYRWDTRPPASCCACLDSTAGR
jgi:hypothetical protein